VNQKDKHGISFLHMAVALQHSELIELLLSHSIEIDARNASQDTPLHWYPTCFIWNCCFMWQASGRLF
jgi:ankyrin repeat protein